MMQTIIFFRQVNMAIYQAYAKFCKNIWSIPRPQLFMARVGQKYGYSFEKWPSEAIYYNMISLGCEIFLVRLQ